MQSSLATPPPALAGSASAGFLARPRQASVVRCHAEPAAAAASSASGWAPPTPFTGRDPELKKPAWLRQRAAQGDKYARLRESLGDLKLNTVCVEAQCPNIGEVAESTSPKCFTRFIYQEFAMLVIFF
jgi:lipoic acid synthetase